MSKLYIGLIICGVLLEMFDLVIRRTIYFKTNRFLKVFLTVILSGVIYLSFILGGYYAGVLFPKFSLFTQKIIAVFFLGVVMLYAVFRGKQYLNAGKLIYQNMAMYVMLLVGRAIIHLLTGVALYLIVSDIQIVLLTYVWAVFLFSLIVMFVKTDTIKVFGLNFEMFKLLLYAIAIILIFI